MPQKGSWGKGGVVFKKILYYVKVGRAITHSKGMFIYIILVKKIFNCCHPYVQGTQQYNVK